MTKTVDLNPNLKELINNHPLVVGFASGSTATALLLIAAKLGYKTFFYRISNADHLSPSTLRSSRLTRPQGLRITGHVTSVGDADNFRLYHTPGFGWNWLRSVPVRKTDLKDRTIHIRLAGIDAPELAHFGNPAQPFSKEAFQFLDKLVNNRRVTVDLLSKDRYNRIVGMAFVRRWSVLPFRQNVSLLMVKAGLATVYRSGGAEYGNYLSQLEAAELKAKVVMDVECRTWFGLIIENGKSGFGHWLQPHLNLREIINVDIPIHSRRSLAELCWFSWHLI